MRALFSRLRILSALGILVFAGAANADELLPIVANGYAGVGYFVDMPTGSPGAFTSGDFGLSFGGDFGLRLGAGFAIVALAEYDPILGHSVENLLTFGGGLRYSVPLTPLQLLLGAGYSRVSGENGFGVMASGFIPLLLGVGPYASVGYHGTSSDGVSLKIIAFTAGLSFSY